MAQSPLTNDIQAVEKNKVQLHTQVGEYLAQGLTNEEILACLQDEQKLSLEEAQATLRGVYDSWSSVRVGLNLQSEDDRNWHHYLRMKLLRAAMMDKSVPSQRLALQILDSLATLQGITTVQAQPVPLSIELVEKVPEPKPEPKPEDIGDQTNG